MKKNFKRIIALGMAISTLGASSAFAAVSTKITGAISAESLKMSITIPTTGKLAITPYAANQISSEIMTTENTSSEVGYKVAIVGYTATAASKTDDEIKLVKALTADNKKDGTEPKEITLSFEMLASASAKTEVKDITGGGSLQLDTLSEEAYAGADSAYTKVATPAEISLDKTNKVFNFVVKGEMNTGATWVAGDSLTIVPIFKITPDVTLMA